MNAKKERDVPYPSWICSSCGDKWGRRQCGRATWHYNICGICKESKAVTEPRDFGHLNDGWQKGVRK